MTDDLLDRLNRWVEDYKDSPGRWYQEMKIAADRIEELERQLKQRDSYLVTKDLWCDFVGSVTND